MFRLLKTALAVLLLLVGAGLLWLGTSVASDLGSAGTRTFTLEPTPGVPVVLTPQTLNRLDVPTRVSVQTGSADPVWMGLTSPSDASTLLGASARQVVTGVRVREGTITATDTEGEPDLDPGRADIWFDAVATTGSAELEVPVDGVPSTLIVDAPGDGELDSVTVTWQRRAWFVEAVAIAGFGLVVALAGMLLLWQLLPSRRTATEQEAS